jgi:hypothetical protein
LSALSLYQKSMFNRMSLFWSMEYLQMFPLSLSLLAKKCNACTLKDIRNA